MTTPLPFAESLTVEFKSDRHCLSDQDLVEAVVCLANTDGGTLYIGVEDDGQPTGLHAKHRSGSERLAAMIANRTSPPINVQVQELQVAGLPIACVHVQKSYQILATTDGVVKRRRLDSHGKPVCVPLLPQGMPTRLSDLGTLDASSLRGQRRLTAEELAVLIQKDRNAAKRTLEALVESDLVEAHGSTKGRSYTLAARVYARMGQQAEYTRQAGPTPSQQEQKVLSLLQQKGTLSRPDVVTLCRLSEDQATELLRRMVEKGLLRAEGERRWRRYRAADGGGVNGG